MSKENVKYFVSLEPDRRICTRCYQDGSPEIEGVPVALSPEEITVLNYLEGRIFEIIDKFAHVAFDLGQKTARVK